MAHVELVLSSPGDCSKATIKGIDGSILGFAFGLQYNEKESGLCYQAWELFAALLMDLKFTIDYLYLTSYWGDGLLSMKSMVDLSASIYGYCQAE